MAVQTTLNMSDAIKQYYDKLLLNRLESKLFFAQFADKRPLPKNSGKTIEFTQYANLAAKITPLTEGVVQTTGDSQALSVAKKVASILQYGGHVEYSDLFETTKIDPALKEQIDIVGYQAGLSIDTIMRDGLAGVGNSTEKFAGSAANRDALVATDILNSDEVRALVTDLKKGDVMPTSGNDWVMLISPVNDSDIRSDTSAAGWIESHKYDQTGGIFNGEVGKLHGVRFVASSNINSIANIGAVDTYDTYLLGKHGYAMTELSGQSMRLIITKPTASLADPLEQVGTIGWKATFAFVPLNPTRVMKLVVGSSVSP